MKSPVVLIFSSDPLGAALLGAALHATGIEPDFPHAGESAREAVRRLRPEVVLVDARADGVEMPSLVGPARMVGAQVVLFAGPAHEHEMRDAATRLSASSFVLPREQRALVHCVQELLANAEEAG